MPALDGTLVVDLGRFVAGPWCGQLLAGLGADVIRVERPGGGEDREIYPVGRDDVGAYYHQCNRGKRSLTLSPTKPAGREVLGRLADRADIIVANVPDSVLVAMGIDWPTLHARNPRCILATITMFGNTGPYAGRVGFDGLGQAMSGANYLSGPEGVPTKTFVPWVDYGTAALTAMAAVAALHERNRTGIGQRVEGALAATAITASGFAMVEQSAASPHRTSTWNRHPAAGPCDIIATADGHVQVQVIGDVQFATWAKLVDRPDLVDDPRFSSDITRGRHGVELSTIASEWCATRTTAEIMNEFAAVRLPVGPVLSPQQVLDDPHLGTQFFEPATIDGVDIPVTTPLMPVRMPGLKPLGDRAPSLGEHTNDVLAWLGYSEPEIATLRVDSIV